MRWCAPTTAVIAQSVAASKLASLSALDLSVGSQIGKGRFKQVHRGILKCTKGGDATSDVVVLRYSKSSEKLELEILQLLARNPWSSLFVPKIYGACDEPRVTVVVQECAVWGSLKSALLETDVALGITVAHKLRTAAQISRGMGFLESERIVHADLSCRNILLCVFTQNDPDDILVKITDFGLAFVMQEGANSACRKQPQAIRWCAPETVAENKFSHRSDVWSLGVTLWEFYSGGETPWMRWTKRANVAARLCVLAEGCKVVTGRVVDISDDFPPLASCPLDSHKAILSCLQVHDEDRPAFAQLAETFEQIIEQSDDVERSDCIEGELAISSGIQTPSEVITVHEATTFKKDATFHLSLQATTPHEAATPSTSATPPVPWRAESLDWAEKETPVDIRTDACTLLPEALRMFLSSPSVLGILDDGGRLGVLKEFLCSPQALKLLNDEAIRVGLQDINDVQDKEAFHGQFFMGDTSARKAAHAFDEKTTPLWQPCAPQLASSDILVSVSASGVVECPQAAMPGVWTLLSLVSPVVLRRREFVDEVDAWAAFNADMAIPCMLRNKAGAEAASRSWIVAEGTTISASMLSTSPSSPQPGLCSY